jgi:hypothetical protein
MHKLKFKSNKTLRSLAKETLNADTFKIAYKKETTGQKGFFLVKDEGIYLMNSYVNKDGERKNVNSVVYAQRFNPKYDLKGDLWDRTYEVSRDDFAENIPFEEEALMRIASGGDITINLSETQLEVIA